MIPSRELKLVQLLHRTNGLARAELSELMELNATTTTRLVGALLAEGVLRSESSSVANTRGRPTELISIHPEAAYSLGLEFGRKELTIAVVNALGDVLEWQELSKPPPFKAEKESLQGLIEKLDEFVHLKNLDWSKIKAIGAAFHDVVDAEGHWQTQDNPTAIHAEHFLVASLKRTVIVEDVSRSFAFAEYRTGAARDQTDAIYVFLGSHGVGGGIFVNNNLLKSSSGVCGELGHVVVVPEGAQCHCGSQGCLETVATHRAVVERFKERIGEGIKTTLELNNLNYSSICQGAAQGDKAAFLVLDELADYLGEALAAAINISGAPFVVIGGQLQQAGESFLHKLETVLRRRVVAPLLKSVQVRYASLPTYAGAWGAGLMALEKSLETGGFLELPADLPKNMRESAFVTSSA